MDSGISIKPPRPPALAARDPVTVRETVATDLGVSKAAAATGDSGNRRNDQQPGDRRRDQSGSDPLPQDLVVDPESRDVIYQERDVRRADREHPDQALLRQRAYRPTPSTPADQTPAPPTDPHADIKA
jgi:hypothetical protein